MTIAPFSPRDALKAAEIAIAPQIFEAFNELLAENLSRNDRRVSAHFTEAAVVERIVSKGISKDELRQHGWRNVAHQYTKKGWNVDHDVPGFNENYKATFTFTADAPVV